ncbi:MAG: hypothetical protein MSS94_00580 [Clostridiales bacterium]|nr:hypothetical protein [Clostridiales bacterium]
MKTSRSVCPSLPGEEWPPGKRLGKRKIMDLFYHSMGLCAMVMGKTAEKKEREDAGFLLQKAAGCAILKKTEIKEEIPWLFYRWNSFPKPLG